MVRARTSATVPAAATARGDVLGLADGAGAWRDRIRLEAFEVTTADASVAVDLTLYWRALDALPQDYTVFVHALGPDGAQVAGADAPPGEGRFPHFALGSGRPGGRPPPGAAAGGVTGRGHLLAGGRLPAGHGDAHAGAKRGRHGMGGRGDRAAGGLRPRRPMRPWCTLGLRPIPFPVPRPTSPRGLNHVQPSLPSDRSRPPGPRPDPGRRILGRRRRPQQGRVAALQPMGVLLPDGDFVYGPPLYGWDLGRYVVAKGGYLAREPGDEGLRAGADMVQDVAQDSHQPAAAPGAHRDA